MSAPAERRIIFKHIDEEGYSNDIDCYLQNGGYEILKKAVTQKPEDLRDEVKKSGLRGRGGAGFSCGLKWSFVDRKSGKPIYLVVNADESEPGTFKDRYIIHQDPHQLIEGTMISCFSNDVKQAYIYIRGEFPEGARILEQAIQEARDKGFVGKNICGTESPVVPPPRFSASARSSPLRTKTAPPKSGRLKTSRSISIPSLPLARWAVPVE